LLFSDTFAKEELKEYEHLHKNPTGMEVHEGGATFLGPEVSDLLHSATIAIVGQVPIDRLWHAVPSFPTVSEVWTQLLENGFYPYT
jgi:hypothetical protein